MTATTTAQAKNWTVAWRKPRANRFVRATDWAGTWDEAKDMAGKLMAAHPELEVWYTSTRQAEDTGLVVEEDRANILVETGRRVQVKDTGTLADLVPFPAPEYERPYHVQFSQTQMAIHYVETDGTERTQYFDLHRTKPEGVFRTVRSVKTKSGRVFEYGLIPSNPVQFVTWPYEG